MVSLYPVKLLFAINTALPVYILAHSVCFYCLVAMSSALTRSQAKSKAKRLSTKYSDAVESPLPISSQLRSPLKEVNAMATTDEVTCSPASKAKGAEVDYSTPAQKTHLNPSTPARRE